MLTPDLKPINGACLFHSDLVISTTEGRLYRLTGSDARDFKWVDFYAGSAVVSDEAMSNIGNDVAYMRKGGNIELLSATQNYGDVSSDDISRWIQTTVTDLDSAIVVYDQTNQKVFFFVSGKVLVFFKDIFYGNALINAKGERAALSPWSVYKTQYSDSALITVSAAKYMKRPGTSEFTVYFGDDAGRIIDMNGEGDDGDIGSTDITVVRRTRSFDEQHGINTRSHILRGMIEYRRNTECSVSIDCDFGDSYASSVASITLKGPPNSSGSGTWGGESYFGGNTYWSEAFAFAQNRSHQNFSHVGRGNGMVLTVSSENSVQYLIDGIEL